MNAVILAGGYGSRLKPFTDSVPKPMLPVANEPMLDYVVSHLYDAGISDMLFTLGYYPEQVSAWVKGYSFITPHFLIEEAPLGTAGGVREALDFVDDNFIVVSGDAIENIDYAAMLDEHLRSGRLATIAVTHVDDPRAFGLVEYDSDGKITAFTEKPDSIDVDGVVNCGVYILNKAALEYVPQGVKYDFARDLFPIIMERGQLGAYYHNGFWSDVGSPLSYYKANFEMLGGGFYNPLFNKFRTVSHKLGQNGRTLSAYSAIVSGTVDGGVIGDYAAVTSDAYLYDCVVLPGVTVSGRHYCEIIGEDGYLLIDPAKMNNLQYSSENYKKFL